MDLWSVIFTQASNWTPYDVAPGTAPPAMKPRAVPPSARLRFALGNVPTMPVNDDQHTTVNDTWYKWLPYFHKAIVIGQPAVSPTASVLKNNSWDWKYGLIATPMGPVTPSNVNLPVGTIPTTGM